MTDNEKTTGVPIEDDALDKVAGGTDQNLKIHVYTYQPGVPNYGAPPVQVSDKPGVTTKMKNDRSDIPLHQTAPDIIDPRTSGTDLEHFDEALRDINNIRS